MDFYVMDLMRIVSDIVESTRGKAPNWERLELKGQDLAVLAEAAQKGSRPSPEHIENIREEIMARLCKQFPGDHAGSFVAKEG